MNTFKASLESIGVSSVLEKKEDVVLGSKTIGVSQRFQNLDRFADTGGVSYDKGRGLRKRKVDRTLLPPCSLPYN